MWLRSQRIRLWTVSLAEVGGRWAGDEGEEEGRAQGALGAFGSVCEAIVSWRHIRCEGLRNEISQLMSAYKHELQSVRALLQHIPVTFLFRIKTFL